MCSVWQTVPSKIITLQKQTHTTEEQFSSKRAFPNFFFRFLCIFKAILSLFRFSILNPVDLTKSNEKMFLNIIINIFTKVPYTFFIAFLIFFYWF